MKSETRGTGISDVEVSHISRHGVWICVGDCEYFMPYDDFPWFGEWPGLAYAGSEYQPLRTKFLGSQAAELSEDKRIGTEHG